MAILLKNLKMLNKNAFIIVIHVILKHVMRTLVPRDALTLFMLSYHLIELFKLDIKINNGLYTRQVDQLIMIRFTHFKLIRLYILQLNNILNHEKLNHLKNSSTIDEPLSFWLDADGFCDVDL